MATPKDTMPPIRAPSNLPELVKATFNKARSSGDVTYYPTQVAILSANSIPFQLRFSPALANKPKAPKPSHPASKPHDPFHNPHPDLLVSPLPPSHILVLNKFAVVPEHFILATAAFAPQTHLLEPRDLEATYACLDAYASGGGGGGGLFAFFNSGPHSGASQPHRHVQLLPVERMRDGLDGLDGGDAWDVLAERLADPAVAARLPFAVFAERLGRGLSGEALHGAYLRLYRQAYAAVGAGTGQVEPDAVVDGEARISYNMGMTRDVMVLCPRRAEGAAVTSAGGEEVGALSLNGTVLAGTALVKNEAEWDALRKDEDQLLRLLGEIGLKTGTGGGVVEEVKL